jgi:hypothetical protein
MLAARAMALRLALLLPVLALASCGGCPSLPPDQFCFAWPQPEQVGIDPGPCPPPDSSHAALDVQAAGTDANGAAIEYDNFQVLGVGDTRAGACCYIVQQTPPCS